MKRKVELRADIELEDDVYVAVCRELNIASQGNTIEEAKSNLVEAVSLWLETASSDEVQASLPMLAQKRTEVFYTRFEVPYNGQAAITVGV